MRRNYFNLSNFLDITLYVLSLFYIFDFKINLDRPNCENGLVSRLVRLSLVGHFLISVLANANWILHFDLLVVKPSFLFPTAAFFWYFHLYSFYRYQWQYYLFIRDIYYHVHGGFENCGEISNYFGHFHHCIW